MTIPNHDYVTKEKLEAAFEAIRIDIAYLHKDLAYSEANKARWIFIIMWIVSVNLLESLLNLSSFVSLGLAAAIVFGYQCFDSFRIRMRAYRLLKEPLEPEFDTTVSLS